MGWFNGTASAGSPGGSSGQLQYNNSSAFGGLAGTSWDDTNRSLTITGATVTTSKPVFDLSQTWNAGGVTFTGFKFNVTDTASAAASLLFDFQVGGSTKTSLLKSGQFQSAVGSAGAPTYSFNGDSDTGVYSVVANAVSISAGGAEILRVQSASAVQCYSTVGLSIGTSVGSGDTLIFGTASTAKLTRDAAETIVQRNGTAAQKHSVYNTYTDASNYERGIFDWIGTANTLTIGTEKLGTGSTRAVQFMVGGTVSAKFDTTGNWNVASGTATPAGGSTAARQIFGTTAAFGIYYGSGAPSVSAAKGSIYLRSDGSGTADRLYVNTDGSTTWTAVTTAA